MNESPVNEAMSGAILVSWKENTSMGPHHTIRHSSPLFIVVVAGGGGEVGSGMTLRWSVPCGVMSFGGERFCSHDLVWRPTESIS